MRHPLLLLPRPLDRFVLGDHARELVDHADAVPAVAGRVPYGALLRAPQALRGGVAAAIGRGLTRAIPSEWAAADTVLVAYHAIQWPAVESMLARGVASEVWYCRWDRYESAHDAGRSRQLLAAWHDALATTSTLTFAVSGALAELEWAAGRDAMIVGLSADAFPDGPLVPGGRGAALVAADQQGRALPAAAGAHGTVVEGDGDGPGTMGPDGGRPAVGPGAPGGVGAAPVAVSLGHLGRRTDWTWLRAAVERMPDLRLLLVGAWHDDEVGGNEDYRWLRSSQQVSWLGSLDDAEAAAVIAQADVGLIPFKIDPFNDAGLPTRILKYARLGRGTISPLLAGARTWERAVTFVDEPSDLVAALRHAAGTRLTPNADLRTWALAQTAAKMNKALHERLRD